MWVHIWKSEFRCFPLCNRELYPHVCWIRASQVKEHNEETCRGWCFWSWQTFHCSDFLSPEHSQLAFIHLLSAHKMSFLLVLQKTNLSSPPEPNFDLEALQGAYPDKSAFRDVYTCSCLKIPHLVISYCISWIPPSLPASSSQRWQSQLLGVQSTAEPVTWWLSASNAWTLLLFLPLLISTAFLLSQKRWLQTAPCPSLAHHAGAHCHSGIWNLGIRMVHVGSRPP